MCYLTMCIEKQRRELLSFALIAFCWNCFRRQKWRVGAEIQKKKKKVVIFQNLHVFLHCEREGRVLILILSWELSLRVKTLAPLPSLSGRRKKPEELGQCNFPQLHSQQGA